MTRRIHNSSELKEGDFVFFVYQYPHNPTIDYGIVVEKSYGDTWVKWLLDPNDRNEWDILNNLEQFSGELFLLKRDVPIDI